MIYYLEDDEQIRNLALYTLEQTGHATRGCSRASEMDIALASEVPDLFLLDVMLPDEDGISVLKRLRTGTSTAAALSAVLALPLSYLILGPEQHCWGVYVAILCGLIGGCAIGYFTEYYTSDTYKPTQELAAASETGSAAAFRWARSETGVPTGTSAPWASPPRGSADDASDRRSAPDRTWKTGTGFTGSSRAPRRSRNGSPPGAWSSSGSRTSRPAPRPAPNGPHGPGEPPPGFPR